MPELPEVETIRRVLAKKIRGCRIIRVRVRAPKMAATRLHQDLRPQASHLARELKGRKILGLRRRAKYLLLELDRGLLVFHLGMTGQIFVVRRGERPCCDLPDLPDKHTHIIMELSRNLGLYFRDIRKFGRVRLIERSEEKPFFAKLGPEPLGAAFTPQTLRRGLRGKTASVKALLLDQKTVAGLGNIYADEALFRARIRPQTTGKHLTRNQVIRLHRAIREVLAEAIRFRGTSMSDYYDPDSRKGGFQDRLRVYGRGGEPCPRCGQSILKGVVAQRGTHWCPKCQNNKTG